MDRKPRKVGGQFSYERSVGVEFPFELGDEEPSFRYLGRGTDGGLVVQRRAAK
jgi:hypothetical protein